MKRTNFQSIQKIESHWLSDVSIERGIVTEAQAGLIKETLELEERDVMSLQNLRDFAVTYLCGKNEEKNEQNKLWDCMSAVTCCIDREIMMKGGDV